MTQPGLTYPVLLSILAALLTLGLKLSAYLITGSVGLLSDAAESIVNLLAAVTAYLSLHYSARPVDTSHTYGHEKIEFFSSGLEGVLVLMAGVGIAWYAVQRLFVSELPRQLDVGIGLAVMASALNWVVAMILIRVGRARRSIVLEADGQHVMTDVWTSAAVLAGVGLVWLTRWPPLDPLIGLAASASIGWTGFHLVQRSFNGLMDHALPSEEVALARSTIAANLEPGMDFHALRTRLAGSRRFIDFHLLVPGVLSVQEAHTLTGRIEEALQGALPGTEVTVHVEPIEERAAWVDSPLVPLEQEERQGKSS